MCRSLYAPAQVAKIIQKKQLNEEHLMAVTKLSEHFDALSERARESATKLKASSERSKDELKVDAAEARARAAATAEKVKDKADGAADEASSQLAEVKGKWKAHVAKVKSKVEAKIDEQDAKAAAFDADLAEAYAVDAILFAQSAIEEAESAALDAVYARAAAASLSA